MDLETESFEQVIDWNDPSISWEGRGKDRGLRGIAFRGQDVYLAASDEIFIYDSNFSLKGSLTNRYLKNCHEICIAGDNLYMTSTAFDSVLECHIPSQIFTNGYCFRMPRIGRRQKNLRRRLRLGRKVSFKRFDPESEGGPYPDDTCHINSVFVEEGLLFVAGRRPTNVYAIRNHRAFRYARIPEMSHNAQPFQGGILLNDTENDAICLLDRRGKLLKSLPIAHYPEDEVQNSHLPQDHARQGFGRGLCVIQDHLVAGGSSPATTTLYDLASGEVVTRVNLSMDVRNAIHGLEVWPF